VQKHFLILLGIRPEAIKLFPVINRMKAERGIAVTVCARAQHRQLLDQVLKLAKVMPDLI
jgi:UDP-N-acetylglucosamine 2-epimerase (non-hydrolysing)